MYQYIGCNLSEDCVPETATFNAFQIEWIWKVFSNKIKNAIITINQICGDQISVIVAGHDLPFVKPEIVNKKIVEFLSR